MLSPEELKQRSDFIQFVRDFFLAREYIEVSTPLRLPRLLPEAEIEPISSEDKWLQTSPEQLMKRLLANGCQRLFQICPCFRKSERGRLHAEEFTMLEWYRVGWNYEDLMQECESLIKHLLRYCSDFAGVDGAALLKDGRQISLTKPWQKTTVADAFAEFTSFSAEHALQENLFDELLVEKIEPQLGWQTPCFLYDYPVELASLAQKKSDNLMLAERFELYIGGVELANGFSELVDSKEQEKRFKEEIGKIGDRWRAKMPRKFLASLVELPPAAGIALGVDRLLMLFAGKTKIDEVMVFNRSEL